MIRVLSREEELGIQWMPGGSTNYKYVKRGREERGEGGRVGWVDGGVKMKSYVHAWAWKEGVPLRGHKRGDVVGFVVCLSLLLYYDCSPPLPSCRLYV